MSRPDQFAAAAAAVSHARRLAREAERHAREALPAEVGEKLKICILDFLACALEAADLPWSRQALSTVVATSPGASIVGAPLKATPADAAFVNAVLGHGLVREDMHVGSISHHGVVVWPVLLAVAQLAPVRGEQLLKAAGLGYQAGARLGRALFTPELARLFRPTGIVAPIGAALAGSHALRLTEDASVVAMAVAANTSSGLNQWPHTGGSEMYFHPGFAARNAVTAVQLARAGAFASEDILEGEAGLFNAFRRCPAPPSLDLFADGHWEVLSVYNKPAPACNFAQTACQASLRVSQELDDPSGVAAITVHLPQQAIQYPGCDFQGPFQRALQAKMSIQFAVAATLARGAVAEENYRDIGDPSIVRLARLVGLVADREFTAGFPAAQGAEVEVTLSDGTRISRRMDDVVPATEAEVRARFRNAAGATLGRRRANEIEAFVDGLDSAQDASRLALLTGRRLSRRVGALRRHDTVAPVTEMARR
jgi:2-methylcitrate dehydratase PrpD